MILDVNPSEMHSLLAEGSIEGEDGNPVGDIVEVSCCLELLSSSITSSIGRMRDNRSLAAFSRIIYVRKSSDFYIFLFRILMQNTFETITMNKPFVQPVPHPSLFVPLKFFLSSVF